MAKWKGISKGFLAKSDTAKHLEIEGDVFFADMSHSVTKSECIENIEQGLLPQKWMGNKILPIKNGYGCDIDEMWQLDMSIRWLKSHGFSEKKTPYN